MPLYSAALAQAASWGTLVAPGANGKIPILGEDWKEVPRYSELREVVETAGHDRGEIKRRVRTFREFTGTMRGSAYYSGLHPILLAAFGAYAEVSAPPVTQRTYGTSIPSPAMWHSVGLDRRSDVWQVDTAIVRKFSLAGELGKRATWNVDMLGHALESGSALDPDDWTFEGGDGIFDLPVVYLSAATEFLIGAFSTSASLSSGNAKALRGFTADLAYTLLGGENTEYEEDKAGEPAWGTTTASGSFRFNRYDDDLVTWAANQTRLMAMLTFTGADKGGAPYLFRVLFPRIYIDLESAASGPGMIRPQVRWRSEYGISTTADQPSGFPTGQNGRSSFLIVNHI